MWEEQAVGRAYRLGQKKPVYVYRFRSGGTFEDILNNKTVFKSQLFSRVIDKKNPERYSKKSVKEYLFPCREVEKADYSAFVGKDAGVLDTVIDMNPDLVRNIELTETFHKEDDDKLTEEEVKAADEEFEEERLKRDDPAAWYRKQRSKDPVHDQGTQSLSGVGGRRPYLPSVPQVRPHGWNYAPPSTLAQFNFDGSTLRPTLSAARFPPDHTHSGLDQNAATTSTPATPRNDRLGTGAGTHSPPFQSALSKSSNPSKPADSSPPDRNDANGNPGGVPYNLWKMISGSPIRFNSNGGI
jgi:hypothetical protein